MSDTKQRWDDAGVAKAMKFWPVIMGIVTLAFALGIASSTISGISVRVDDGEKINNEQSKQIATLEAVVKEMPEMRSDIKAILREIRRK